MRFVAKTLYGLEDVLAGELSDLGAGDIEKANRAVLFCGDLGLMYSVNYMSRCAVSVLLRIGEFDIRSADDLYLKSQKIKWERYIDPENTFSVIPVVKSVHFNHTGYAGLKLKDSIADYFRSRTGRRPSVDTVSPSIIVNLHISNQHVTISLDSSGDPLFKRGYRRTGASAPLNEVLAAGMIMLSGWRGALSLIDPMCGSGTIPIEAAMLAAKIPPGKKRASFAFQRWKNFDRTLFENIKSEHDNNIVAPGINILGFDVSENAVKQAEANAAFAGVSSFVEIRTSDFKELNPPDEGGILIMNPPYGERLLQGETDSFYNMMGTVLKHNFAGYEAWIISSNKESLKHIGLKPVRKYTLFNGALECTYLKYELYKGTRKGSIRVDQSK